MTRNDGLLGLPPVTPAIAFSLSVPTVVPGVNWNSSWFALPVKAENRLVFEDGAAAPTVTVAAAVPVTFAPPAVPVTVTVFVSTEGERLPVKKVLPEVPNPNVAEVILVALVTPGAAMTNVADCWMSGRCW